MIRKNFKLFMKSKHISIPLILLLFFVTGKWLYTFIFRYFPFHETANSFDYLSLGLEDCLIIFLVLVYCSYELYRMVKKSNMEEVILSHKKGQLKTLLSIFVILFLAVLYIFLIEIIANIFIYIDLGFSDFKYLLHIFSVNFLYIIFSGIIAILLGLLLASKFKRRVSAYAILSLIIFVMSPVSDFIPGGFSLNTGINLWQYKRFLSYIIPSDITWYAYWDYGINAEIYRWNLSLFWIFLLAFLLIFSCVKLKKIIKAPVICALAVLTVFNGYGYFKGGSSLERGPEVDSISMFDYVYYTKQNNPLLSKEAKFQVYSYKIDLNIWRQLEAEVSMTLSDSNLKSYDFTLYHGYDVQRVTDFKGNPLSFERNSDYLTITGNGNISGIKIKYSGSSEIFYSNSQAVCLPGFFPYYPIPGFYPLKIQSTDSNGYTYSYLNPIANPNKADFEINVSTSQQVYSNLEETSQNNSFKATTDCPVLLSGFYKEKYVDGYRILDSSSPQHSILEDFSPQQLQTALDELDENTDDKINLEDYTIIYAPPPFGSYGIQVYYSSDVILISYFDDYNKMAKALISQKDYGYDYYREQLQ